jgi:hypothetical protein
MAGQTPQICKILAPPNNLKSVLFRQIVLRLMPKSLVLIYELKFFN